jgi:pimeloyl-ACP methyl ester carboxylesterase
MWILKSVSLLLLLQLVIAVAAAQESPSPQPVRDRPLAPTHGRRYAVAGLPQSDYTMDAVYEHGMLTPLSCAGTVAYIIKPKGAVDPERRWVWISNLFLALNDRDCGPVMHRYYVEGLLAHGFHIVGIDVGASCGSPRGADIYEKFYQMLMKDFQLNPKARMIGQSNGGLITYGFAFRHPERVDRVLGICPATDFTSWPGWARLIGPGRIVPEGIEYSLSKEELEQRQKEFNPIDNLAPLAKAGIKIYHIHGTNDDLVPLDPNSAEFAKRYKQLGGDIQLEIVEGGTHGAPNEAFFQSAGALQFLLQ